MTKIIFYSGVFQMPRYSSTILKSVIESVRTSRCPEGMSTRIIAVDGGGGAGKTTLASELSDLLCCEIIHTDDFATQDCPIEWFEKLLESVLVPLSQNLVASFRKYDWMKKTYGELIEIKPQPFLILEGVSSSRREFRRYLAYKIYVETDSGLRLSRGLQRDGPESIEFWKGWMREEDRHFRDHDPKGNADLVVSGVSDEN